MQVLQVVPSCVVLVAAATDLRNYQIYNWLTIPFLLSGILFHTFVTQGSGVSSSILGIVVGVLPFFVVYLRGGMGAGDIKLLAGVGAWLGPWLTLHVIIISGLATGCWSIVLFLLNRVLTANGPDGGICYGRADSPIVCRDHATEVVAVLNRRDRALHAIPFGVMVALGVIVTLVWIE